MNRGRGVAPPLLPQISFKEHLAIAHIPSCYLVKAMLDETQLSTLRQLVEGTKNTRQLTNTLKKSREHTARLMKELFELGLVRRNVATKPFVYQITNEGRCKMESSA